ncbi:hypothetical protein R80B4_00407 [Fibrobacteres bacterium R8-0-B4]
MLSKHRSRPRNPKIANTFFRSGFIEAWGRGIERITAACREAGRREPLFEVSPGEVAITFYIDGESGVNRSGKEADGGVSGADGGVNGGVNDFRKAILELMIAAPTISTQRIADTIGTTKRRIGSNINAMKKAGLLDRVGTNKTGHWKVRIKIDQ